MIQSISKIFPATRVLSRTVMINLVTVCKSLGGGWESRAGRDFVPEDIRREMTERTNWGQLLEPRESETRNGRPVNWRWPDW